MTEGGNAAGGEGANAADELVEWIDPDGHVLQAVTRAEMRAGRLRHRAVFIAVVDRAGRVVVHQRAAWKDVWPSAWDLAFGGVVAAGETWEAAAARELAEEAGLHEVVLAPLGDRFAYDDDAVSLLGRAYLAVTDAAVRPSDGEVVAVDRVPIGRLRPWAGTRVVCPDSWQAVLPALEAWDAAQQRR